MVKYFTMLTVHLPGVIGGTDGDGASTLKCVLSL